MEKRSKSSNMKVLFLLLVLLCGVNGTTNLIQNGDFQNPSVTPNWGIFNEVASWVGNLEIGYGPIYNSHWSSQVVELDTDKNELIFQNVNLEGEHKYLLKYQYGARQGVSLESCQMNVYWNGQIVDSVLPTDYNIITKQIVVSGINGQNKVGFEGTGTSDGLGITIDNIQLYIIRLPVNGNYIENGNFETPAVTPNWGIFNPVDGWKGTSEIGYGPIYNPNWNSQVVELDANANEKITQEIVLIRPSKYLLKYQYAARSGAPLQSSQMVVYWNGVAIDTVQPSDYNVLSKQMTVTGIIGVNTVMFQGSGSSDSLGITVDNVELYQVRQPINGNYIINGDFESPSVSPNWGIFNQVKAWTGNLEIGDGAIYNANWNSQVVELDGNNNELIKQSMTLLNSGKYLLKYQYAARVGVSLDSCQMNVYWNNQLIHTIVPNDYNVHVGIDFVEALVGTNSVSLEGAGLSDSIGMTVDNVELYKYYNLRCE